MAKAITFVLGDKSFQSSINKIDRDKVYGFVEELVTDASGNVCTTGSIMDDGSTIILSGATALKTVDKNNNEVDKKTLKAVYMDGKDAVLVPSSYDQEVMLQNASVDDLYNLEITAVYQMGFEDTGIAKADVMKMLGDDYYQFVFNYRADYEGADAIMLATGTEVFVLTGRLLEFNYLENKNTVVVLDDETTADSDDSIDFGML